MQRKVLILGGYGNFGKRIAKALTGANIPVVIAGRNHDKAQSLKHSLPEGMAGIACFDAFRELDTALEKLKAAVVVNSCGPFQSHDYTIAESCIRHGVHYIDLADGRDFVTRITALDREARKSNIAVISGASTVPGLSSAVLDHFKHEFAQIDALKFGISPGQQAERGLATTQSILSYVGKPLKPFRGHKKTIYGWQDLYRQDYPALGKRWMANCDIPDLDLLPEYYGIKSIRFSAGLELGFLHLGLWGLSWLVRLGLPLSLPRFAGPLLSASNRFNAMGSADGGMHMIITGKAPDGTPHRRTWFIIALNGHGPHIPTIPAIILTKKLVAPGASLSGAKPCLGLVTLEDCLQELRGYESQTHIR
jgi:hypothetical protein